jgi:hypothetical protein
MFALVKHVTLLEPKNCYSFETVPKQKFISGAVIYLLTFQEMVISSNVDLIRITVAIFQDIKYCSVTKFPLPQKPHCFLFR